MNFSNKFERFANAMPALNKRFFGRERREKDGGGRKREGEGLYRMKR